MNPARKLLIFAGATIAFALPVLSQVVTNVETITPWSGNTQTFLGNQTMGQTFTNVSAVTSMTYAFFTAGSSPAGSLAATFGEWTGSGFVADTIVDFGVINIPASSSWDPADTLTRGATEYKFTTATFDLTQRIADYPTLIHETYGYLTDPSSTYALMLTNQSNETTGFALGWVFPDSTFPYGTGIPGFADYAFSQISVYAGDQDLVPVPEASTVAAMIGAAFIAGLVGLRIRQRRQLAALPAAPVAA